MTTTTGAVLRAWNEPLELERIDVASLKPDEILVRTAASGLCGSDLHLVEGALEIPGPNGLQKLPLPIVPGHEAAGVVEEVGPQVQAVEPGDHVIVNIYPGCGHCSECRSGWPSTCRRVRQGFMPDGTTRLRTEGEDVHHMAFCSSFAEHMVVQETGVVRIRPDMPLDRACLIGCGVTTGYSAVFNVAKVEPGSSVLVVGTGGVGLNVIQSARLAQATTIIAVDVNAESLAAAESFGATHQVDGADPDWVDHVLDITGGVGADFGFEAVSTPTTIRQTFDATRARGLLTIVGLTPPDAEVTYPATITKTVTRGGIAWSQPWVDFPRIVDLYMDGRLLLDELVTRARPLSEVNEALSDLKSGQQGRTILEFPT